MSKKFYETAKARSLIKTWDKKLKDSGFHDIESNFDKQNGTGRKEHFDVDPVRIAYFKKCEEYLHKTTFIDNLDKHILERHCAGDSNHTIGFQLKENGFPELHQSNVARRLLKILKAAGITPIVFKF